MTLAWAKENSFEKFFSSQKPFQFQESKPTDDEPLSVAQTSLGLWKLIQMIKKVSIMLIVFASKRFAMRR